MFRNTLKATKGLIDATGGHHGVVNGTRMELKALINGINDVRLYSRGKNSNELEKAFKVVKSKMREEVEADQLGEECGPNWELFGIKGNRFYFPNNVGPAWQGATTTVHLEAPLETLVDFEGTSVANEALLQFSVGECPSLIKSSLDELFPTTEVTKSDRLAVLTLKLKADDELGPHKFVLAAREISARLRMHGYWADFMNPFSGKPFYSWGKRKSLYKVDSRFRGINMQLITQNNCTVISPENDGKIFSGVIYTTAPSDYLQLKLLIDDQA